MKKFYLLLIVCLTIISSSCRIFNDGEIYNAYVALPNAGWNDDSLAVFHAKIDDNKTPYDITLQIRNQSFYRYANLWLFVDVVAPSGQTLRDTVELTLANSDGSWIGAGWGSLYSLQCPYRLNTRFSEPGDYTFRISHGMRDDDIEGIHSVGLRIVKAEDGKE
ncbi:MAG: gliding motility lipoprotein GldH [Bacteroidales bacterium]|nr:gliding motility lipoprotein GldH [Bacteroidales bacterium]